MKEVTNTNENILYRRLIWAVSWLKHYTHNSDRPLTCLLPHHTRCQPSSCQPERSSPVQWATLPWCIACLGWRTLGNSPAAWSAETPNLASCAGGHSEVALGPKTIKRQKVTAFSLNAFQLLQVETASMFWYSHSRNGLFTCWYHTTQNGSHSIQ